MTSMNRRILVAALGLVALGNPTNAPPAYNFDRKLVPIREPGLRGTPPNPNRKTKAEKKRDRKEKQRASAAERQAREEPPVASARRTET
jgi:hypothetical protein